MITNSPVGAASSGFAVLGNLPSTFVPAYRAGFSSSISGVARLRKSQERSAYKIRREQVVIDTPRVRTVAHFQPSEDGTRSSADITKGAMADRVKLLGSMFVSSFFLGPFLDGYHGLFDILAYTPGITISVSGIEVLKTAIWVPWLFGVAGVIMGGLYIWLDEVLETPENIRQPTFPQVFSAIAYFSFQYYLSGLLAAQPPLLPIWGLNSFLLATALACYALFDRSLVGLAVGALTAFSGPAVEVVLTSYTNLYHYTHPDFGPIPSWIPWVYLAGAPAVGNLARRYWQGLVKND